MTNHLKLKPFKNPGPGETIQEKLNQKDWTQDDLAYILGISKKHLNEIINHKTPISLEIASLLGKAFNTSTEFWINLDLKYRLIEQVDKYKEKEKEVEEKTLIYKFMPIKELFKKGWLEKTDDINELKRQILNFWEVSSLERIEALIEQDLPRFKKSESLKENFNSFFAQTWCKKSLSLANNQKVAHYQPKKLQKIYDDIHEFTVTNSGIGEFIDLLNQAGVKFLVVPHLQKTYLDGAAFMDNANPVVIYTARFNRLNNFWFTVSHEIAHILLHLDNENSTKCFLDSLVSTQVDEEDIHIEEQQANDLASQKLLKDQILEFFESSKNYVSHEKIRSFGNKYRIHPAVVVGVLAHHKIISYANIHRFNDTAIDKIPAKYIF